MNLAFTPIIITIMIIIMIAFKCTVRDFFTISSVRRKLSPTRTLKLPKRNRVQITCNTSSAYHVQRVVCHLVRRDISAVKFDRVKIAFISSLFLLAEIILTDEGGEETGAPVENP